MKTKERESLISAYNRLASADPELREFIGRDVRLARSITDEDYQTLEPFLFAEYETAYKFGAIELKVEGKMTNLFTDVISTESRDLLFASNKAEAEFFFKLATMINAVTSPLFDRTKSSLVYERKSEGCD